MSGLYLGEWKHEGIQADFFSFSHIEPLLSHLIYGFYYSRHLTFMNLTFCLKKYLQVITPCHDVCLNERCFKVEVTDKKCT